MEVNCTRAEGLSGEITFQHAYVIRFSKIFFYRTVNLSLIEYRQL